MPCGAGRNGWPHFFPRAEALGHIVFWAVWAVVILSILGVGLENFNGPPGFLRTREMGAKDRHHPKGKYRLCG